MEVNRKNFGLTLDFGHCLAAGENPAQSAAMAARGAGVERRGSVDGVESWIRSVSATPLLPGVRECLSNPAITIFSRSASPREVGAAGKLFGVQLNDGYQRLGAEDAALS